MRTWAFEEMYNHTAADVQNLMNARPLPGGELVCVQIFRAGDRQQVSADADE
jgi:hypothetical protein